jgi:aerobic C4-dicarboxylate transport protein
LSTMNSGPTPNNRKVPFYMTLWGKILIGFVLGVIFGFLRPHTAVALQPLGIGFIRLINMIITIFISCSIVMGIASMQDMKKVGRIGGKALLFFEILSTLALVIGLSIGNVAHTGAGFNVNPATLNNAAVAGYATAAKSQGFTDFLLHIIPTTVVDAFARGDMLEVVFASILFGFALMTMGKRSKPLLDVIDSLMHAVTGMFNIIMKVAPIGVFGAIAYTVGNFGFASLGALAKLILVIWFACLLFVFIIMGVIGWAAGFSIIKFLEYIKEEIVLTLATSSSSLSLLSLMEKMEQLGCSKTTVGLVVPMAYTFNPCGACLYITLASIFVAEATNIHLTLGQLLTIFAVASLTSKGASGVQASGFIGLVATLMALPAIPLAGVALLLGIDQLVSPPRATTNLISFAFSAVVVARWEHEVDAKTLRRNLSLPDPFQQLVATPEEQLVDPK